MNPAPNQQPNAVLIAEYQLAYNSKQGCAYRFRRADNQTWSPWYNVSAAELAAIALIFHQKPIFYDPQNGSIYSGAEQPGIF